MLQQDNSVKIPSPLARIEQAVQQWQELFEQGKPHKYIALLVIDAIEAILESDDSKAFAAGAETAERHRFLTVKFIMDVHHQNTEHYKKKDVWAHVSPVDVLKRIAMNMDMTDAQNKCSKPEDTAGQDAKPAAARTGKLLQKTLGAAPAQAEKRRLVR